MPIQYRQVVPPAVLLLLGIVGIMLVVLSTEEIKEPPENMVNEAFSFLTCYLKVEQLSCHSLYANLRCCSLA